MDGFHQMRFFQTVLFKRYNCLGLQDCFVDSEIIAAGLVSQTFEGRHYYCSIHLHQEGFDALVKKKQKVLLVNLSLYIRTFSVISQNPGKDHQAKLWTRHKYKIQRATVEATVNYERKMCYQRRLSWNLQFCNCTNWITLSIFLKNVFEKLL